MLTGGMCDTKNTKFFAQPDACVALGLGKTMDFAGEGYDNG